MFQEFKRAAYGFSKVVVNSILFGVLLLLSVAAASAATTHTTSGSGIHSSGSHTQNRGHIWVDLHFPHSGDVTSGGRFHDSCSSSVCVSAFGGDLAIDIGAAGNTPSKLWLDYAGGNSDSYQTNPPNNNMNIWVYAYVSQNSNIRNPPQSACAFQRYDVVVYYYDMSGTLWSNTLGSVWILHNSQWNYGQGSWISPNGSRANAYGSGTVYFINGIQVGKVYNGSGSCSTGPHTHMEFYSLHNWGSYLEWHSYDGPDYYSAPNHIHYGTGYAHSQRADSQVAWDWIGWLGGGSFSFYMIDNGYYGDH